MDYEKKYKEANKKVAVRFGSNVAKEIFADLYESEDKRMIEAMTRLVKTFYDCNFPTPEGFERKDMLAWLEKQGEQKPAWSEEDEERLQSCLNILQAKGLMGVTETINTKWLKSLKDRVQPKQEWSEEDEKMLQSIITNADRSYFIRKEQIDWLKSLRPQSHWRPSKEQMNVLNEVINFAADHGTMRWNDYIYNVLKSLREQLKEL